MKQNDLITSVHQYPLDKLLNPNDFQYHYSIPYYQRAYTWSKPQWEDLYNDISMNKEGYFMGTIICISAKDTFNPVL